LAVIALSTLLIACSRRLDPHALDAPALPRTGATPPAPEARQPLLHAWTSATTLRQPVVPVAPGVAGVVVHVPENFDGQAPLHLVLFFHGSDQCVAQITMAGDVTCEPGKPADVGAGFAWRLDEAGTMSLFAAPQFLLWGGGAVGRMGEAGYFRGFVQELVGSSFVPGLGGPRSLDDVADITIIAHSAGHLPLVALLELGDLDDKVRNVVLVDALYDGIVEPYARWLERGLAAGQPRKLVAIYGGWGKNDQTARAIASRIERRAPGQTTVDPPGAIDRAVAAHRVTMKHWPDVEHAWMLFLTSSKVLEGLGLPTRTVSPPREPDGPLPQPIPLPVDTPISGSLGGADAFQRNGAHYKDYEIHLAAGQHLSVDLRGGHSETEACCTLDVFLQVIRNGDVVAEDDDNLGFFDAHVDWTAPAAGPVLVRASTYGSGRKRGAFTLRAGVSGALREKAYRTP
jgi:hypothetical protein